MQFDLLDEQRALQDSIERMLKNTYDFERRRVIAAGSVGHDERVWRQLVVMGICGVTVAPEYGGFGGGASALYPVMRSLGAALSLEPVLAHAVLAPTALQLGADETARQYWLPRLTAGEVRAAWAHAEEDDSPTDAALRARAQNTNGQWTIDAHKPRVLHGASATHWIVSASRTGEAAETTTLGLYMVERDAPGVSLRRGRFVDDTPFVDLQLENTPAHPLNADDVGGEAAAGAIEAVRRIAISALSADAVGTMETAYHLSIDYLGTRKQFGRMIGEYQALRHRAADMLVSLELCRSMAMAAASAVDHPDGEESTLDIARAKAVIGLHGRRLCEDAIQLHGGIGMTEEYAVGHCLRRMVVADQLFGPGMIHRRALGQALSLGHISP